MKRLTAILLLAACDPSDAWPCGFGPCDHADPTGGDDDPPIHPCEAIAMDMETALLHTFPSPWNYEGPWAELLAPSATMSWHSLSKTQGWWAWDGDTPASGVGARLQGGTVRLPMVQPPPEQVGALRVAWMLDFEYAPEAHERPYALRSVVGQRDPITVSPRGVEDPTGGVGLALYYVDSWEGESVNLHWASGSYVGWAHSARHAQATGGAGDSPYVDAIHSQKGFVPAAGWCLVAEPVTEPEGVDEG